MFYLRYLAGFLIHLCASLFVFVKQAIYSVMIRMMKVSRQFSNLLLHTIWKTTRNTQLQKFIFNKLLLPGFLVYISDLIIFEILSFNGKSLSKS